MPSAPVGAFVSPLRTAEVRPIERCPPFDRDCDQRAANEDGRSSNRAGDDKGETVIGMEASDQPPSSDESL
jgi:hypothetical protein